MAANRALGIIEARGIVAISAGIEAMCKTADVECIAVYKVGMGYLTATIEGTVASVRQAIEVGEQAVRHYGELRGARMFPKPDDVSVAVIDNGTRDLLRGDRSPALGSAES